MQFLHRILTLALWLIAAYAIGSFLRSYSAPDVCLDALHGSFDYKAWTCSLNENKPYIETPIYWVPGFAFALCALVAALGAPWLVRRMTVQVPR